MTTTSFNQDLETLLDGLSHVCEEHVSWRGGQIELDCQVYLTGRESLPHLTSSGRCIVLSGDSVLMMTNPTDTHILPGGRLEPGEAIAEATRREVREETGLELTDLTQVGILVYRHRTPKPTIYRYPYPVFLNTIHVAAATNPEALLVNDTYELAGEFVPFDAAMTRIAEHQRVLLKAAILGSASPAI